MRSQSSTRSRTRAHRLAIGCGIATLAFAGFGCTELATRPDVTIGTVSPTGTDYPLGASICRLFNLDAPRHHMRCAEELSSGYVANIEALRSGKIDIGIVLSDVLADAAAGRAPFGSRGPATDLRILFAGHDEMLTVVVRRELGIRAIADLRGKRIDIGNAKSRQRSNIESVMAAFGLARGVFADVRELPPIERYRAFCGNEIDAIVYSVSHPNGLIQDVTRTCNGVLVEIAGPEIDRMLSEHQEYERAAIPGGIYVNNLSDVRTFGVRAAVVTTSSMAEITAYEITKAVFENFDAFRRLHPTFGTLRIADMIQRDGRVPMHPGALRYYRERGWIP